MQGNARFPSPSPAGDAALNTQAGLHRCFQGLPSGEKPRPGKAMAIFKLTEF